MTIPTTIAYSDSNADADDDSDDDDDHHCQDKQDENTDNKPALLFPISGLIVT